MYVLNYLYFKQSINTDELNFNTYDTIITYFLLVPQGKNFSLIMNFSSFRFLTILSHVRNKNSKILLFCLKALVKTFHMIPYT